MDAKAQVLEILKSEFEPLVAEIVEENFKRLAGDEGGEEAGNATDPSKGAPDPIAAAIAAKNTVQTDDPDKGRRAARYIMALAGSQLMAKQGKPMSAAEYAKTIFKDEKLADDIESGMQKALAAGDATAGGFIVREEVSSEIIELLRPNSVVRLLNPRMMDMDTGTLTLPKVTGGVTAAYVGENQNITKQELTFGQVKATAKKIAALVPISNDLIRRADASAEGIVRDDLVASIAQVSDLAFIRNAGTAFSPKGLKYWATAANTLNAAVSTGNPSLANITTDLGAMILALTGGDSKMLQPGWLFSDRSWIALMTIRDSNGNFAFREEMVGGTLWGWPFQWTSQIPDNLDASGDTDSDESEVYLADFSDVIIAESTNMLIDASSEAAYHDGSAVVASFSLDQTVIRAILEHDLVMRHDTNVIVMEEVTWGTAAS